MSGSADSSGCHTTGRSDSTEDWPWSADPRAHGKNALCKYIVENPTGAPIVVATREAISPDANAGDADHRLALRFYRNYPRFFKTDRRDGMIWVWPRTPAFTCPANKHSPKPADDGEVADDTARSPKENARNALRNRNTIENSEERGYLLDALATYRESTDGRYNRFDKTRGIGAETLLIKYVNRFNASNRVADSCERLEVAFAAASERYDRAVVVTLTTDPSRYDSLLASMDDLIDDVSRFKSWIATDTRIGYRPPSVVVPEFSDKGIPHAHIVLFGVSWVVAHEELSSYWSNLRNRGEVVWFDRLVSRNEGGRWRWSSSRRDDVRGRSPRSYLAKSHDALTRLASASSSEVRSAAGALRSSNRQTSTQDVENGDEWWQLALYWALDMSLFTVSPCLTSNRNDKRLPHIAQYEYIGTARLANFPGFVRERAVILSRPRSSATTSGGGQ